MTRSAAVKPGTRDSGHVAAVPGADQLAAGSRASRHRPAGGLLRPSRVPARPILETLRTPGQPLAGPQKQEMEARLGADFSDVRVHTGTAARASAAAVGARAYTSGSHVVIGDGGSGERTLAHELTHVVQQRQGPVTGIDHGGLKVSDPSDRFEREAEANETRSLNGSALVAERAIGGRPPAGGGTVPPGGEPAVQRAFDYEDAPWSREHLPPDGFATLLAMTSGEGEGTELPVPYRDLYQVLDEATEIIPVKEATEIAGGARAEFSLSPEATGGELTISPPPQDAGAAQLRDFASTVAHEMQHARDAIGRRFSSGEAGQTPRERRISSELRAFGREAAAAVKLALGDTYDKSRGKLSQILRTTPEDRLPRERKRLAEEYHVMDSYRVAGHSPLDAFSDTGGDLTISIASSLLLERVAGYLTKYKITDTTQTSAEALAWLRGHPVVVEKGLVEGVRLFHDNRPQPAENPQAASVPGSADAEGDARRKKRRT